MSIVYCDASDAAMMARYPVLAYNENFTRAPAEVLSRAALTGCRGSSGVPWVQIDATRLSLQEFSRQLAICLLRRRTMNSLERRAMVKRLGGYYSAKGAQAYGVLKHTLHEASSDQTFRELAAQRGALWLEFGVFRGLSINITSKYVDVLEREGVAHGLLAGFDTFTGLPEKWHARGIKRGYKVGYFSLNGVLPAVRPGVRLFKGLFNETLPFFLHANPGAPLAWANVDCDLYAGARDALTLLGPRVRVGSRLHFHELVHGHKWNTIADPGHSLPDYPLSDEARALYEWLRFNPLTALELLNIKSPMNTQAAAFVVRALSP